MALRSGHGKGGSRPHVEVLPANELPVGTRAPARLAVERDESGRLRPGPGTSELARRAGKAAHESRQLAQLLGLWAVPEDHPYAPYARLAREWRDAHIAQLSANVAGGALGPGPASIVSTAALQMGASRWMSDEGAKNGDAQMLLNASRLGDSSRQNLLAAHELAAKEGQSREQDSFAALHTRLGIGANSTNGIGNGKAVG